jgi:hypothetical protein
MRSLIIILISFVFLSACTTVEQPMTAEEKAEIKATITELFDTITAEILDLDFEGLLSHYKLNENFSIIMDGVITIGGDTVKEMVDESSDYYKEFIHFEFPDFHVIVLDRDLALVMGLFDEMYVTSTEDTLRINATNSYLLQLEDTGWKISHATGMHKMAE